MKILILNTQSINHNNATGITLRSLFNSFDTGDLYEIYLQPCKQAADALSFRSERLSPFSCPLRYVANKFMKGGAEGTASASTNKKKKVGLKTVAAMLLDYEPVFITPKLIKKIRAFAPDCIYTLGSGIDTMKLVYRLSKKLGVPIVPHFMDNWSASHRFGPDLFPMHLRSTQKWLRKLYSRANCGITISEKMADEYEKRWSKKHYALMNAVNVDDFRCTVDYGKKISTFVYAGGLHLNRYKSLLDIARAIEQCNKERDGDLSLQIYTDEKSRQLYGAMLSEYPSVKLNPYVDHGEIKNLYEKSDALIHIETFDEEYREFIRYSLSTKISEYLATGKPILLYAPEDIFVYEYLKANNAALTACSCDGVLDAVYKMTNDFNVEFYSRQSMSLAEQKHDAGLSARIFSQALSYKA